MKTPTQYKQIDYQERETIALGIETGLGMRAIARMLGRPASAISREIGRNSGGLGYSCRYAQQRCERRRKQGRPAPKRGCQRFCGSDSSRISKRPSCNPG